MVTSKRLNGHLKTIRAIVVKGFSKIDERFKKVDERFDRIDERIDGVERSLGERITGVERKIDYLSSDIDDLAAMTANEFKAVRSEIAVRSILPDLRT